jgi:sugar O-acyltransferase (sialic acid O-acetyltransferase NeuD family)
VSAGPTSPGSAKPVVIFGVGAFAEVAEAYLRRDGGRTVLGYTVDGEYATSDTFAGLPVLPWENLIETHPPDRVELLVATGFKGVNKVRRGIYERCKRAGYGFVTYVNSKAMVMSEEPLGENTFIFEANVIQPFVQIGDDVVIWSGNHIGHHSRIASHCFIASHAVISGHVRIGEESFVGVNATFRDGIEIGRRCVIGAGAVVLADQAEGTVLKATPAPMHPKKSWELRNF